ncbi:MAG: hypothetical protein Q9197_006181 [Variospora fuerteventurae]
MNSEHTIWRALWCPEKASVRIASHMKLVPPAKSGQFCQYIDREAGYITVTGQLIEFEAEGDRKEEQLVADGNEELEAGGTGN